LIGKNVAQLLVAGEIVVVSITRNDQAFIPVLGTEFKEGTSFICRYYLRPWIASKRCWDWKGGKSCM